MIYEEFDLNSLKIFVSVYENGGMVNASKKLFLSQPAVTMAIKKLEERLGGNLFIRLPKGIKPTPEGKKFYDFCKEGLAKINSGIKNFSENSFFRSGSINIGADTAIAKFLMPKIKEFSLLYPNVRFSFTEVISSRLQKYLVRGDIDIAFELSPIKNLELFDWTKIATFNNIFISSTAEKNNEIAPENFPSTTFATLKNNTNHKTVFEEICTNLALKPNIQFESANFLTLASLVQNTKAIGFVAKELIKDELTNKTVFELKTTLNLPQSDLIALLPKGNNNSYICEKFLSLF